MARDNEPIYEKITNKYTLNNNNNNSNSKSSPDIYPGFSQRLAVDTLHFNANPGAYIRWKLRTYCALVKEKKYFFGENNLI